jgi:hypothetical protein
LRRYCSSGEPAQKGGASSVTSSGSESSSPPVLATMQKAEAMYEPPDTAARYFERWRTRCSSDCSVCSAPRLNAAERIPPPEQHTPMSSRSATGGS